MAKKTSEFPVVATLTDSDTLTGIQSNNLDINITVAALKAKVFAITDSNGYFVTDDVEAALQQVGRAVYVDIPATYQPLDPDLTAIASLTTTSFGRDLLKTADAAALRTTLGAQPLDADLTSIASLTTTAYGRDLLTKVDAATTRTYIGAQAADQDLTDISALTTTDFGRKYLTQANAAAGLTYIGAAPTASPTFTGTVTIPDGATATTAASKGQMDTALTLKVDKATLINDDEMFIRRGGVVTRIALTGLANDKAFTDKFALVGTVGPQGPKGDKGDPGLMAPLVVKTTAPTAADYGQASIPLNAVWIVSP